nr:ribonuclease H-like domain, reverse transcriptase, RNA-dependent DNA polymerase [Tanacetum cinerariifolium]
MSDHEDETITQENAPPKVVPPITTVTNISAKFPYLKKGDAKSMTTDKDSNLKIHPPFLEIDTKGYSSSSSTPSNAAFVSTDGSSQGNLSYQELGNGGYTTTLSVSHGSSSSKGSSKSKYSVVEDVIYSFFANHEIDQHLVYKDLDQMNKEEFEEYDLKHQMAMLSIKVHRFKKKHGRKIKFNGRENARIKIESDADSEGEVVFANDAIPAGNVVVAVVSPQSETEFALMDLSTEVSMSVRIKRGLGLDKYIGEGELGIDDSKVSILRTNSDELEGQPIYNRFTSVDHIKAVPPPLTGNYMPPSNIPDIDESQMIVECSRPNHSDHDLTDSISSVSAPVSEFRDTIVIDCDRQEDFPSVCSIETDVKSSQTLCNKFGSFNKESHFRKLKSVASKSCYVCGSYLHLIKDCDLHEQRFAKRNAEGKGILGRRPTGKPVNPNRPKLVSAGQQNPISAGPPNPVSAGQQNLVYAS